MQYIQNLPFILSSTIKRKMKKYNPQNEAFRLFRTNRIIS